MEEKNKLSAKMEEQITEKLSDAFESVVKQKNEYYQNNPQKIPEIGSTGKLISSAALTNSAISGGASLIPGPYGMLAVVPEIILVTRNQISLIYDIAAAHGKRDLMTKELAAMVFVSAMGSGAGSLLVVHGGKYLVRRTSLRVFQRLVTALGGKITQQALKSTISKWLPGVGAAAMAAWTNYLTRQIGKKATEIFSSELEFEDNIIDIELIEEKENSPAEDGSKKSNDYYKIQALSNLMKIDGKSDEEELALIASTIEQSNLTPEEKISLISNISSTETKLEGIEIIADSPSESISLIAEMIALAKADGKIHITEKLYIKQVGKMLGFSDSDIEEMISA
ncbi:TerB family tellurite resistance protein [Pseudomonas sp. OF001]|uniref:TerB family tellurite resistance protein n=1 Tax=Pseudomonas sp. OF001 TaxID=2772300 RepID=UPI0019196062|nr:TerB family tellurite resistance protein [Pseudomonas sp. OF001]CAD5375346.1 TerB family tellurite resistance protein [Pseudomonas sp. OF001]